MKLRVAALATVIVAVAVFPVAFMAYKELYVKPFVLKYPEHVRPYVEYEPFFSTTYGYIPAVVWVGLGAFWLVVASTRISKSKLKAKPHRIATSAILSLIVIAGLLQVNNAKAVWMLHNVVDVLMIGDEEFRAHPDWMENAENVLQDVSQNRFEESYIRFYARGWLAWDSLDSRTDTYDLMQEALAESGLPRRRVQIIPGYWDWGFIDGSEWVDDNGLTWYVDLLLIFTGQDCDMKGMSIPVCNMTIIRHDEVSLKVMTHELGHQFYLDHCGGWWCVMNDALQWGDNFCDDCRDDLTDNADKWPMDEYTPSRPDGPSSGYRWTDYYYKTSTLHPDGWNVWYQFDWGDGSSDWTEDDYPPGEEISMSHRWNYAGAYIVRTRAKDRIGRHSEWSLHKKVSIVNKPGNPCPILFVWNGLEYVETGVLDIHSDADITFMQGIESTLVPENHLYKLSLKELDEFTSHIDYVKLYAVNDNVEEHECHLVQAVHTKLGQVLNPLLFDDGMRVDLTPMQTIDLKFTVPNSNEISYFIFEINGYNIKP